MASMGMIENDRNRDDNQRTMNIGKEQVGSHGQDHTVPQTNHWRKINDGSEGKSSNLIASLSITETKISSATPKATQEHF